MMKNLAIGLFLAFAIHTAQAQTPDSVWHLVNSGVPNATSMIFSSNDTGFLLGTQGITRTTTGGASFTTLTLPTPIDTIHEDTNGHSFLKFSIDLQIDPTNISSMSWPVAATGYVAGVTYAYTDAFKTANSRASRPTILSTADAGTTWKQYYPSDTLNTFSNIYFPAGRVGFASGGLSDQSKNYISRTLDSGKTWSDIYESDNLVFEKLNFFDAKNGIVFANNTADNSNHLLYTTDQGASFHNVSLPSGSLRTFLRWNEDSSWIVAIDSSIYRSIDSGAHWPPVVTADTDGNIQTVAMHDSNGFAFRSNAPVVLRTRDYGMTWKSDTLPPFQSNTLQALSASMPSDSEAYLFATDQQSDNLLFKIVIPTPVKTGGNGAVAMAPNENGQFSAATEGNEILFTANAADRTRAIDVMDILGRVCASITLSPGATTSQLSMNILPAGSYFARLGGAMVKFAIWN